MKILKHIMVALALTVWGSVTVAAVLAFYHVDQLNQELRSQIDLLQQVRGLEAQRCEGIFRVNSVCEKVVYDFATQLGLDALAPSKILTTGISARHQVGGMGGP